MTTDGERPDPVPQTVAEELDVLIRARYPIIYVVSWEETRVEQQLQQIADKHTKELYEWSVTHPRTLSHYKNARWYSEKKLSYQCVSCLWWKGRGQSLNRHGAKFSGN